MAETKAKQDAKAESQAQAAQNAEEKKAVGATTTSHEQHLSDKDKKAEADKAAEFEAKSEKEREEINSVPEEFGGQYLANDDFGITSEERFGRAVIEIKPIGWVGPGFEVAGSKVKGLAKLLGQVKNLPEAPKAD
jgi:archaellum component FlaD/FlaE